MLERLKLRRFPGKYLSTETMERLLRQSGRGIKPPEVKHFQYIVILLDDTETAAIPDMVSKAVTTLAAHRAVIVCISSSLIVGIWGSPFNQDDSPEVRRGLVDALVGEMGIRMRIAHGQCDGAVGILGSKVRMSYGAVIPGFSDILKSLLESAPGAAIEIA